MREFILRHKVGAATIVAVLVVATVTIYSVPLNPPLGDCFDGLLSQEPPICYVLEHADGQGIIDVETVYNVEGALYFFLRQDEDLRSDVYKFFRTKLSEFYDRWPDDIPVLSFYDGCLEHLRPTYRECYLEKGLARGLLPKPATHKTIRFYTGGDVARRLEPGWASWRQVWPATAAGGASGSSETPTTFDVSDVDMTNLPVHVCPKKLHGGEICSRDQDAALSVTGQRGRDGTGYFQVKDPPKDEARIAALKEILYPCYDKIGPCTYTATTTDLQVVNGVETYVTATTQVHFTRNRTVEIEIIPVKYSLGELTRWAEILDRFATSRGNTIGIVGAELDSNRSGAWIGGDVVWPLDDLGPAETDLAGEIPSTIRETIVVWSLDPHRVSAALPTLLPALGIPVDAVGVVVTEWVGQLGYTIFDDVPVDWDTAPSQPVRFASAVGVPVPLLLLARNVGAVLVAGGIVALVLRLRRRRAPG